MNEILVTGSAGFIGSYLYERLQAEMSVDGFDIRAGQDGLDFGLVKTSMNGINTVFHLANIPAHRLSIDNPYEIIRNNYNITLNFAEACRIYDARMVFASSFGVYGNQKIPFSEDAQLMPKTPYGMAKKSCEELLKIYHDLYGLDIIIIRPSNVWGERDYLHEPLQVLPLWINSAKKGKPLVVSGKNTTRDFTHITDVVDALVLSEKLAGFEIFNVASGKEIRLLDIARSLSSNVVVKPLPAHETERWCGDISKAKKKLGWLPEKEFWPEFEKYCLEKGIKIKSA